MKRDPWLYNFYEMNWKEKKRTAGVTLSGNHIPEVYGYKQWRGGGEAPPLLKANLFIMQNNWEPRVGQKVVALLSSKMSKVKKGDVVTVGSVVTCPVCGEHKVGIIEAPGYANQSYCGNHLYRHPDNTLFHGPSKYFAPLPEQYADMTAEIAKSFIEHPDKADQPVKVLETVN